MKKKILIIGSGGREHAVGWKLSLSPHVGKIYFAPGNTGTAKLGENLSIKASEIDKLLNFAKNNKIDLTVVGPEDPLALGIVNLFEKNKLAIFGPTNEAARLESSKAWAADFMKKYNIPQPESRIFRDYKEAIGFLKNIHDVKKIVIKASGLALGKGVVLPQTRSHALETIKKIMVDKEFGEAGKEVVIQERLTGPEVSMMAVTDGITIIPLLPAQDHKRIFDNDKGPNTGGMGAYAPVPFVDTKMISRIKKIILQPTIDGMRKEKSRFAGVLFAGLMMTDKGPKVLEFNVRFGDPETQPIMTLLDSDLYEILLSCAKGKLKNTKIRFKKNASACIVLASKGYPGSYVKGDLIRGLDNEYRGVNVFYAGTAQKNRQIVTNGGRVLGVTSIGKDMKTSLKNAYSAIGKNGIYFKGMQYRKDIGKTKQYQKSYIKN